MSRISVLFDDDQLHAVREAAARVGLTPSEWLRRLALQAANRPRRNYAAERRYWARRRIEAQAAGRPFVVPGITHGLSGYKNFSCRCGTCKRAKMITDAIRRRA